MDAVGGLSPKCKASRLHVTLAHGLVRAMRDYFMHFDRNVIDLNATILRVVDRVSRLARDAQTATFDLFFPPHCFFCGTSHLELRPEFFLCSPCLSELTTLPDHVCRRCAVPLPASLGTAMECPNCHDESFNFSESVTLGLYADQMREAILKMKKPTQEPLTMTMGHLLADRIIQYQFESPLDIIVAVPMHWSRRIRRGINQSELLASAVSHRLKIPVSDRLLTCCRNIKKQATLSQTERQTNVRNAFRVSRGYDIQDARVLVVDDVMTTGATSNEIARVCRKAGAASVVVATVARGIGTN